jgi:3-methyladenine DNA glycosylase/8-oxoguanine DNA glycosylase
VTLHRAANTTGSSRTLAIPATLDVRDTVRGAKNPVLVGPTEAWWSTRTPDGPGSLSMMRTGAEAVEARAWGPGAGWLLDQAPRLLGSQDDLTGFQPRGPVARLWRRKPFLLARTDRPWDALVGAVLGQRVQTANAARSRRQLARLFGERAPGPRESWILPPPEQVAEMGYHQLHRLGVERRRADILIRVAREMPRLHRAFDGPATDAEARLRRVSGIGPWTAAMVVAVTLGHADAVPVGDFHLPNTVAWLLAGEPRATDKRMLELLEPYAGHRWRVARLAKANVTAPRYGPKLSLTGDGLHRGR